MTDPLFNRLDEFRHSAPLRQAILEEKSFEQQVLEAYDIKCKHIEYDIRSFSLGEPEHSGASGDLLEILKSFDHVPKERLGYEAVREAYLAEKEANLRRTTKLGLGSLGILFGIAGGATTPIVPELGLIVASTVSAGSGAVALRQAFKREPYSSWDAYLQLHNTARKADESMPSYIHYLARETLGEKNET